MNVVEFGVARLGLFKWAADHPEKSPFADYGTAPADMENPMVWSVRDGQMLQAFIQWWNQTTGDTEPALTELTPSGLLAIQKYGTGNLTPTNPTEPTITPAPTMPGYPGLDCATLCESLHGAASGTPDSAKLAQCLQACANGIQVEPAPPASGPLPAPPEPVSEPAAPAPAKKGRGWLWVAAGVGVGVLGVAVWQGQRGGARR